VVFLQVISQHTIDRKVTVGLLFVILSAFLFIIAFLHSHHSAHHFADRYRGATEFDVCIKTKGQEDGCIYGWLFKTAGWIVVKARGTQDVVNGPGSANFFKALEMTSSCVGMSYCKRKFPGKT